MIPEPVDDGKPTPPPQRFAARATGGSSWEVFDRQTGERVPRPDDPDGYRRAVGELFSKRDYGDDWNAAHEAAKARAAELNAEAESP